MDFNNSDEKKRFIIYTDEIINLLIRFYEEIGTFNGVKNHLKEKYGISISDTTIKKKLRKKFKIEGRNFQKWLDQNKKSGLKYTDEDLDRWEELFETIGSFLGVSKHVENQSGIKVHDTTIKRGLERKFKREGRNFEKWVFENDKSKENSGFEEVYTKQDIIYWIELYQEIGSYKGVVKYLLKKIGNAPLDATIKRNIQKYFFLIGRDFAVWESEFSKFTLGVTQGYTIEEVERWERLYQEIGSFQGVSDYYKEVKGVAPAGITIKRRIRQKFIEECRDFDKWMNNYEDWHFKLYSEEDVKKWIQLYERIGSFYGVEKYLKDKYGQAPQDSTVFTRIKQRFESKNKDFNKWKAVFGQQFFEEICRSYFELIFRAQFPKKSPEWLRNPFSGRKMHLDGYNIRLQLAFEYNGLQHYEFIRPYHKTYQDLIEQQKRDVLKSEFCSENNVILITIPYTIKLYEMQGEIIYQYEELSGEELPRLPKYDYKQFFYNYNLDRFLQ